MAIAMLAAGVLGSIGYWFHDYRQEQARNTSTERVNQTPAIDYEPTTLAALLSISQDKLGKVDLGRMNLLCAENLPGSEKLDLSRCLAALDKWTTAVAMETERNFHQLTERPDEFHHSEAEFRMGMLVTVVQQDFGIHYNKKLIGWDWPFTNSRDFFIHGMLGIGDGDGGSCSSMPALYTAIARRLGYPVHLVTTEGHLFCRWDGDFHGRSERINFEGTNHGFNTFGDDEYRKWPVQVTPQMEKARALLITMTPAQELSAFLALRAACYRDTKQDDLSRKWYGVADDYHPGIGLRQRVDDEEAQRRGHMLRMAEAQREKDEYQRSDALFRGYQQQPMSGALTGSLPIQGVNAFGVSGQRGQQASYFSDPSQGASPSTIPTGLPSLPSQ